MSKYPVDIIVEYNDTTQYRALLRQVFSMNHRRMESEVSHIETQNQETLDDETRDEAMYDDVAAQKMLEHVYHETVHIAEFRVLYERAAARMFSTDLTIGQAVLFSYDYFYYFHACLVEFFSQRFSTTFGKYEQLINLLS